MAKHHNDIYICPLLKRKILYGECYEVQEIREDEMDMEFAVEKFDIAEANRICEECKWFIIENG